jgi:alkanesulfonate monooxygenase SsuD/methylene tetrahydromethanopterin reductase-like flavin-dependent oxidoreductase (luciferase family)
MQVGVFDFWNSLTDTVEIAERAEALGYSRLWLAEHLIGGIDCSALLPLSLLAAVTNTIRVGTAGVQIRFHNPMLVARGFRFLESYFPGRIDAGFCAGGGPGDKVLQRFDREPPPGDNGFLERGAAFLEDLRAYEPCPSAWTVGNGLRSAQLAGREGTCFAYSVAHQYVPNPGDGEPAITAEYRSTFVARPEQPEPRACLVVAVACADSESDARRFLEFPYRDAIVHVSAVGTAGACRARVDELARFHGADEVVLLARSPELATTLRAYELLAEAFELEPTPADAVPAPMPDEIPQTT